MDRLKNINWGPFLVMLGAALWAVDPIIRVNLQNSGMQSSAIVFWEHVFGFALLSPIFYRSISSFKKLTKKDWVVVIAMSIFSSVLGTFFFTQALSLAFASYDFITPTLIQKLQPIFVVGISVLFLKEKISLRFVGIAIIAILSSYLVSFGGAGLDLTFTNKELVYLYSIIAAMLWGSGTVLSKMVLNKLTFYEATSLRFFFAVPVSFIMMLILNEGYYLSAFRFIDLFHLGLIAIFTGAGAILIYYLGLKSTKASIATFAELTFPIITLFIAISTLPAFITNLTGLTTLNPYGEAQILDLIQFIGVLILIISILLISFENIKIKNANTKHS